MRAWVRRLCPPSEEARRVSEKGKGEARCTEWKHFVPQPGAQLCDCGRIHAGLTVDGKSGLVVRLFTFVATDPALAGSPEEKR